VAEKQQLKLKWLPDRYAFHFLWGSLFLYLICYLGSMINAAQCTPLWMDEILLTWTSRLSSVSQIYSALIHGSDFSPPTQHILLHYFSKIAGGSNCALRLPSIVAVLLTGLCTFILYRRHLGNAAAVFGTCLVLESLRIWGLQVRPYALVTACFAAALLLWDGAKQRPAWWRDALIGFLLALATSLHFYAVLFVPCFGVTELIYVFRTRKFQLSLWIALVAAGASIFIWLPLIRAISHFNSGDTNGPAYYAKPTLTRLGDVYRYLFVAGWPVLLMLLAVIEFMFIAAIAAGRGQVTPPRGRDGEKHQADFWPLVIATVLFPLIVFSFSLTVTKTFNARYSIAAIIGTSAIITVGLSKFPFFQRAVPLAVVLASLLTLWINSGRPHTHTAEASKYLPEPYPIVIADGLQFFTLEEAAMPEVRSRLVYLTLPPEVPVSDLTNQHAIERWKVINPRLPVENMGDFLKSHPKFYVLDWQSSDDTPAAYLLSRHLITLTARSNGTLIYASCPPSQPYIR
jgi:hypothetical protein